MSSRSRKRRREVRQVEVREIDDFSAAAVRQKSKADRIMDWILFGDPKDGEAVGELFPLPGNVTRGKA